MARSRMLWLTKRRKTAAEVPYEPPIRLGNMSNGDFFHQSTPQEQRIRSEILRRADEAAPDLGCSVAPALPESARRGQAAALHERTDQCDQPSRAVMRASSRAERATHGTVFNP